MKRFLVLFALLAALVMPVAAQGHGDHDDETPLGEKMESMNKAFRQLRKQIADPAQNESSLELLAIVLDGAKASLAFKPAYTAEQPADAQEQFVKEYHEQMTAFVAEIEKTIATVKAGDQPAAEALVKALGDAQRKGHRQFRAPKE
jgi:cytochrome c556